MTPGAIGGYAIGAGQHRGGKIGNRRCVRAHVGAVIVEEFIVDAEDMPFSVDCGPDLVTLMAGMIGGDQVFAPVLYPFYRFLERQRGGTDEHVLGIQLTANTEAAADMAFIELHLAGLAAEHEREPV